MKQYIIPNSDSLEDKVKTMKLWGANKLHILADFDRTLTKAFYEGKPISSIASFLYENWSMSEEYQKEWKALFDHYYPIEIDHTIGRKEKTKAMDTWRNEHLRLMVKHRLSKNDLEKVVAHKELQLREYTEDFFSLLATHKIPSIIMSASGIWYDSIWLFFEKKGIHQEYIDIISNAFIWDDKWYAIGRKDPVIHSMNKNDIVMHMFPNIYEKVVDRKNVILLWDSLHDVEMIDGFNYDVCIKIWFCNTEKEEVIQLFSQSFDVTILHDWSMQYALDLVKSILQ